MKKDLNTGTYSFHLININLLAALFLMLTGHTISYESKFHPLIFSVYVPMLYFWFAGTFENEQNQSNIFSLQIKNIFLKILFPGILAIFISNCQVYFSSDGQTPVTFLKQIKIFLVQIFWADGITINNHPTIGTSWFIISLFWCALFYMLIKRFFSAAWLRIALSVFLAIIGSYLSRKSIYFPLGLDVSLVGILFYTAGAETIQLACNFSTNENCNDRTFSQRRNKFRLVKMILFIPSIILWLYCALYKRIWIEFAPRNYQNPLVILEAFAGILTISIIIWYLYRLILILTPSYIFFPSWMQNSEWVVFAVCIHALDGMTHIWWGRGNPVCTILLRFLMLLLVSDLLFYIKKKLQFLLTKGDTTNELDKYRKDYYFINLLHGLINHFPVACTVIFYVAFAICYFVPYFDGTTFRLWDLDWTHYYEVYDAAVTLIAIFAIHEIYLVTVKKRFIAYLCILSIGFFQWQCGGVYELFILCLLIVAMTNRSMKTVLRISLAIGIPILLAAFYASQNGYIYNFIYSDDGHALGIIYKTDCMAHWFYALLAWAVIRDGCFMWFEYPIMFFLISYLYHLTGALNGFVCMLLFLGGCFIIQLASNKKHSFIISSKIKNPVASALCYSYPAAGVFSIFSSLFFADFIKTHLNGKLSSITTRLNLSYIAFQEYPITLLGQNVPEQGNGGLIPQNSNYFFIDNSYVRILIIYGLLLFFLILVLETQIMKNASKEKFTIFFLALFVIALHSIIEHHLTEYWYNTFLLLAFIPLKEHA